MTLEKQIESELRRIGVQSTRTNPEGLDVYFDELLPLGWCRISDSGGTSIGPATEILAALQSVPHTGEISEDGISADWEATWEALGEFGDIPPQNSPSWPEDLMVITQIEEGTINDNPATLIEIKTNGGTLYAVGAHGVSECALSDAFQFDCLYDSRDKALEDYGLAGLVALSGYTLRDCPDGTAIVKHDGAMAVFMGFDGMSSAEEAEEALRSLTSGKKCEADFYWSEATP